MLVSGVRKPGGRWRTSFGADGIEMSVEREGEIAFALPAFAFDGESSPDVESGPGFLAVKWRGWVCRYETDGEIVDTGRVFGNRNGHYRIFESRGKDRLDVKVEITQSQTL